MSRIDKYKYNNNYCELDGTTCTHCRKCDHIPTQSNNRTNKLLIVFIITFIIIFILIPLYSIGIQKHNEITEQTTKQSTTLENQINNYNDQISADERYFKEYYGLGSESVGENYNPMG